MKTNEETLFHQNDKQTIPEKETEKPPSMEEVHLLEEIGKISSNMGVEMEAAYKELVSGASRQDKMIDSGNIESDTDSELDQESEAIVDPELSCEEGKMEEKLSISSIQSFPSTTTKIQDTTTTNPIIKKYIADLVSDFFSKGKKPAKNKKFYNSYKLKIPATDNISVDDLYSFLNNILSKEENIRKEKDGVMVLSYSVVTLYKKFIQKDSYRNLPKEKAKSMQGKETQNLEKIIKEGPKSKRRKKAQDPDDVKKDEKIKKLIESKVSDFFVKDGKLIKKVENVLEVYSKYIIQLQSDDKNISAKDILSYLSKHYGLRKKENVKVIDDSVFVKSFALITLAKKILPIGLLPNFVKAKQKSNEKETEKSPSNSENRTASSSLESSNPLLNLTFFRSSNKALESSSADVSENKATMEKNQTSSTPSTAVIIQNLKESDSKKHPLEEAKEKRTPKKNKFSEQISELEQLQEKIVKQETELENAKQKILKHILDYQNNASQLCSALDRYSKIDPEIDKLIKESKNLMDKVDSKTTSLDHLEQTYLGLKEYVGKLGQRFESVKLNLKDKHENLKKQKITVELSDSDEESNDLKM